MLFLKSCRPFINLVRQGGAGHDHCTDDAGIRCAKSKAVNVASLMNRPNLGGWGWPDGHKGLNDCFIVIDPRME